MGEESDYLKRFYNKKEYEKRLEGLKGFYAKVLPPIRPN